MLLLLLIIIIVSIVVIIKSHLGHHWGRNTSSSSSSRLLIVHIIIATIDELRWWTVAPHVDITIAIQMIISVIICSSRRTVVSLGQKILRRRRWRW